jgi:hypothetical protein
MEILPMGFPVALAIIFGNEDKEGWTRFWKLVQGIHPTIQEPKNTIITDQQKGSIPALADVLPSVVIFSVPFTDATTLRSLSRVALAGSLAGGSTIFC